MSKHPISRRRFLTLTGVVGASLFFPHFVAAQNATYRRLYCPALMYHHIGYAPEDADSVTQDLTVTPELFSEHLAHLQSLGFTSVTMSQLWDALNAGAALPEKPVILTFDDGYTNAYEHAFPRLRERGMVGIFYLISGFMGQPGYMNWDQAREMQGAGMEMGNHTHTHPDLSRLDEAAQREQIETAATLIGEQLGARPRFFCYPLGRFNNLTVRLLRETGHITATTTQDGTLKYSTNPYRMSRVRVRNTTTPASLEWLVNRRV